MSWDPSGADFSSGNVDFGAGNVDFSSGNAQGGDFGNSGGDNFNSGGDFGNSGGDSNGGQDRSDRPPRPEPTEEQLQHRNYNWASNRARYEYNENALDEQGMAPRDSELEAELFEANSAEQQTTIDFSKYEKIPVRVERGAAPKPILSFDEADLHPVMKDNVRLARYSKPTPVQMYSVPIVTGGHDLMACAQTGSGKTAAFLIPTLSALFGRAQELQKPRPAPYETRAYRAEPLVLVIAPTRELCSQIFDECRRFTYRSSLRPCAVYGGADSLGQIRQLERGCDVLAAAPGRLMDFIQRGKIGLSRVKYLILDEADRMLDMGFEAVIRQLILKSGMPSDRQTLLFSATFPRAIRALARDFLRPDYLFLRVGRVGGTSSDITQKVMHVEEDEKREALRTLLNSQPPSRTLIFVETKRSADSLDHYLYERGFPSTSIHGDRTQMEREDALLAFKRGKCPILVATAVAARGIDIRNVMHVINYDMPQDMDEYIHRIGRTARVGKTGLATSFYNDRSNLLAPELTKLLAECKQEIPDFLKEYEPKEITWDADLEDTNVEAPSYAGQEYVPMERNAPGAPQGYNNAEATGAADGAWESGNGGDGGYGNSNSNGRPGDWDCPDCGISNFASRQACFKCSAARPEGAGGGAGGRGPRPRREGDWDCPSCGISNFASRTECFKCQTPKEGGSGGFGGDSYGGDNSYGGGYDNQPADTSNFSSGGGDWNAGSAGWNSEPAAPAASNDGGWNAEPAAPAQSSGGWGASEPKPASPAPAQQAAQSTGGWGASEPAAPAQSSGGWGAPEPKAASPAPTQQPAQSNGGWGASEPAAPAQSSGGWGAPEPKAASPAPTQQPAQSTGGWGASSPAPAAAPPAAGGWGEAPPVAAGGWGEAPSSASGSGW